MPSFSQHHGPTPDLPQIQGLLLCGLQRHGRTQGSLIGIHEPPVLHPTPWHARNRGIDPLNCDVTGKTLLLLRRTFVLCPCWFLREIDCTSGKHSFALIFFQGRKQMEEDLHASLWNRQVLRKRFLVVDTSRISRLAQRHLLRHIGVHVSGDSKGQTKGKLWTSPLVLANQARWF